MHSVLIGSPLGKKVWSLQRSTEIIGYHRSERRVNILLLLLAINKLKTGPNTLCLMHRGNVQCRMLRSWPMPHHSDEGAGFGPSLLEDLYGDGIQEQGDCLLRQKQLTAWDSWHDSQHPERVRPWPPGKEFTLEGNLPSMSNWIRQVTPQAAPDSFVPFVKWELGDFTETGLHLIACEMSFSGETYDRLVGNTPVFTVDGPRRLLSRIVYDDLASDVSIAAADYHALLQVFRDPEQRLTATSHDIVLLGPPSARVDDVRVYKDGCTTGIYPAPRPVVRDGIRRFLARDQCFSLALSFEDASAHGHIDAMSAMMA